jgi:hypothetical protein
MDNGSHGQQVLLLCNICCKFGVRFLCIIDSKRKGLHDLYSRFLYSGLPFCFIYSRITGLITLQIVRL